MKKQAAKKKESAKKTGKLIKPGDLKVKKRVIGGAAGTPKFGPFYSASPTS